MPERIETTTATGQVLVILGLHNIVQNQVFNERGYVPSNLVVTAVIVGVGRRTGLGWAEMGLNSGDLGRGLRSAAAAAGTAAIVGGVLTATRARLVLDDERTAMPRGTSLWRRALVRFPLGTALFEEVAFRGVLPALLARRHGRRRADALSAGVFAAWHLIPTQRALRGNRLGQRLTRRGRVGATLVGAILAGLAGLGFSWGRRRAESLLAPWLVHASMNTVSFLAGALRARRVANLSPPGPRW